MNLTELIERLNSTPNWMRESFGDWKGCVSVYDRAPFEAAEAIKELCAALAAKDEAIARHIKVDEFLTNCPNDVDAEEHIAALEEHYTSLANMHNALALQPRTALVAKIKADAVSEFISYLRQGDCADRIQRGEVK